MTIIILIAWALFIVLSAMEWRWSTLDSADLSQQPLDAAYKFNHWLPRLLLWIQERDPKVRALIVKCVCLPHPWKLQCIVLCSGSRIRGAQRKHEVIGHGYDIVAMGPVGYLATYVWHFILRRGNWSEHMMERSANFRATASTFEMGDLEVTSV